MKTKKANLKSPAEMLYRLLVNGGRITHNGYLWGMGDNGKLYVVMCNLTSGGEYLCGVGFDMSEFYSMAEEIGRDKIFLKLCELQIPK